MLEILQEFLNLLHRSRHSVAILENETDAIAVITQKTSVSFFKDCIEEAIKEDMDYESVAITKVESFDFGYKLELYVDYVQDGESNTEKYFLNKATQY